MVKEYKSHSLGYINRAARLAEQGYRAYKTYNKVLRAVRRARGRVPLNQRYRKRRYTKKNQRTMKKRVRRLEKCVTQQLAKHTHRRRDVGTLRCAQRVIAMHNMDCGGSKVRIEAAMANLRFFDPATNSLVFQDPANGTYQRDMCVEIHRKLSVRNNYNSTVKVKIYDCVPKDATALTPVTMYNNSLNDQGNPGSDSPMMFVTDAEQLRDVWRVKLVSSKVLKNGQQCTVSSHQKDFQYQVATNDAHTTPYDKNQGGHLFLIRIEGVLAHDSLNSTTQQALANCGIDWMCDTTFIFRYDAGKGLNDFSIADNSTTMVNVPSHGVTPTTEITNFAT